MCDHVFNELIVMRREEDRLAGLTMLRLRSPTKRQVLPAADLTRPLHMIGIGGERFDHHAPTRRSPTRSTKQRVTSPTTGNGKSKVQPVSRAYPAWTFSTNLFEHAVRERILPSSQPTHTLCCNM